MAPGSFPDARRATVPADTGTRLTERRVSRLESGRAAVAHTIHSDFENAESFIMSQPLK